MKIEKRNHRTRGQIDVLVGKHGVIGEYFGDMFVKGYPINTWCEYGGETAFPISEDVLMFNKHRGFDEMCLYHKNIEIYTSVDEFMAFGTWVHSKGGNGDWIIWCPLSMLNSYPRVME